MKLKKNTPKPKSKIKIEAEEDFDFDFSIYEREEKKAEELQSVKHLNKPTITGLRSKYSPSMMLLERLVELRAIIIKKGIEVAKGTQDIHALWDLYGCLDQYWAEIHDIFGTIIIGEINQIKKDCYTTLIQTEKQPRISYSVNLKLLQFRDKLITISQRAGLGFEVEKTSFSHYDKAKKAIIE